MLVDLVQIFTRDGVRLEGALQVPSSTTSQLDISACCMIHGTGGSFYSSTLFDSLSEQLLKLGCAVLKVNTRGHDLMSTAALAKGGGRRLGAAYEIVDDCRHDLVAWFDFLQQRFGPRIALVGHSLGAVKSLYSVAHEAQLTPTRIVALSPPRLAYSWFCANPEASIFLEHYRRAEALVAVGEPNTLLEVTIPLPFVITAAGYVEKYGPDERYDYLQCLPRLETPTLITLGEKEVQTNVAFRTMPDAIRRLERTNVHVEVVAEADHFYSGVRDELWSCLARWLR